MDRRPVSLSASRPQMAAVHFLPKDWPSGSNAPSATVRHTCTAPSLSAHNPGVSQASRLRHAVLLSFHSKPSRQALLLVSISPKLLDRTRAPANSQPWHRGQAQVAGLRTEIVLYDKSVLSGPEHTILLLKIACIPMAFCSRNHRAKGSLSALGTVTIMVKEVSRW